MIKWHNNNKFNMHRNYKKNVIYIIAIWWWPSRLTRTTVIRWGASEGKIDTHCMELKGLFMCSCWVWSELCRLIFRGLYVLPSLLCQEGLSQYDKNHYINVSNPKGVLPSAVKTTYCTALEIFMYNLNI